MKPFALIVVLFLAACSQDAAGMYQLPASEDHGPYPSSYREMITADLNGRLKDPTSLRSLQIGEPYQFQRFRGLVFGGGYFRGWASCVGFDAKNSFGAYSGTSWYTVLLRDGQVLEWDEYCED